jgi:hypothetical protein
LRRDRARVREVGACELERSRHATALCPQFASLVARGIDKELTAVSGVHAAANATGGEQRHDCTGRDSAKRFRDANLQSVVPADPYHSRRRLKAIGRLNCYHIEHLSDEDRFRFPVAVTRTLPISAAQRRRRAGGRKQSDHHESARQQHASHWALLPAC